MPVGADERLGVRRGREEKFVSAVDGLLERGSRGWVVDVPRIEDGNDDPGVESRYPHSSRSLSR